MKLDLVKALALALTMAEIENQKEQSKTKSNSHPLDEILKEVLGDIEKTKSNHTRKNEPLFDGETSLFERFRQMEKEKENREEEKLEKINTILFDTKNKIDKFIGKRDSLLVDFSVKYLGDVSVRNDMGQTIPLNDSNYTQIYKGFGLLYAENQLLYVCRTTQKDLFIVFNSMDEFFNGNKKFTGLALSIKTDIEKGIITL